MLFAVLPLGLGAAVVVITLTLPGGLATSPRDLCANCLFNAISAFALAGVIQVWFTMGEIRRANFERERAEGERESAQWERERAAQAETALADTRAQMQTLTALVEDLRRQLDDRTNGRQSD